MTVIDLWLEYLNMQPVRYSYSVHPLARTARTTAAAERVRQDEFAKTVVYLGSAGFGIAVVATDQFAGLAKSTGYSDCRTSGLPLGKGSREALPRL